MLSKSEKTFSLIFGIIVLIELLSGAIPNLVFIHYIAKPSIVISLLFFFWKSSTTLYLPLRYTVVFALLFSVIGDILLMLVVHSANYFLLGLVAFLLAHIMYVLAFLRQRNSRRRPMGFILLLLVYAIGLFNLLKDGLNDMLIPVTIYMLVILSMAIASYLRRGKVPSASFSFVFIGALFFMISDSILALNKFYQPLPFSNTSIMLTYALAQYCIVIGILKSVKPAISS